jgi:hypothetical protein
MHDEAFADSVRPAPCVILRLPMRPYSIGHELLLYRRRNPFVTLDDPAKFSQLPQLEQIRAVMEAAQVCARTWQENGDNPEFTRGWNRRSLVKAAIAAIFKMHWRAVLLMVICSPLLLIGFLLKGREKWLHLWGWLNRDADYGYAINEFWHYRRMGSLFPPRPIEAIQELRKENEARTLGGPYLARLYLFVQNIEHPTSNIQRGKEEAWDYPLGMALFLALTKNEAEGGMSIESEDDLKARTDEKRIEEQILADIKAGKMPRVVGSARLDKNQRNPQWQQAANKQQAEAAAKNPAKMRGAGGRK